MTDLVFHNSQKKDYRSPFGAAATGTDVRLSLDAPESAICTLRLWSDEKGEERHLMHYGAGRFSANITLPEEAGLLWYFFIIEYDGRCFYLGAPDDGLGGCGHQKEHEPQSWQITVFEPYTVPQWYKDSIVYQIFPDRFSRGADWELRRTASKRDENRRGARRIWHEDWNDNPFYAKNPKGEVTRWDFFGGTLEGVREKLPYLRDLGVGAIYLNPIFLAASNHRYDTADYKLIDPLLGDIGDFEKLCADAHEMGMRIILDGVFSHTGADSRYFDYFGNYGGGAYSDMNSSYRDWYRFSKWPDSYESWWGVGDLPNVDEENESYKRFICTDEDSVARTWLRHGADGWRLDVADELPDSFIESFRYAIKDEKPDSLLLGEVWEDASNKRSYGKARRYLFGRELDSTMHYPFRSSVTDFLLGHIDSPTLCRKLMSIAENYPPEAQYSALNLIDSHDRSRAITVLGGAPTDLTDCEKEYYSLSEENYKLGVQRLKLASLLQYACPGVPCIYYGDEAGLEGFEDPHNRKTYPWGHEDTALLDYYKKLGSIYNSCSELRQGDFEYLSFDDDIFACRRFCEDRAYLAIINRSANEKRLTAQGKDLFSGQHHANSLTLPPLGFTLLELDS